MPEISTAKTRKIIEDFYTELRADAEEEKPAMKYGINFRDDRQERIQRTIWRVPIDLLRYRKNNSRLNAQTIEHETFHEKLIDNNKEHQLLLGEMLEESDTDAMGILLKDLAHKGQIDPAIATCDGFLINGNRRRRAIALLSGKEKTKDKKIKKILDKIATSQIDENSRMRVVVLPSGKEDKFKPKGAAPKITEIQQIEYSYQNQKEGRSDYSGINIALQYRYSEEIGISLRQQLKMDTQYATLSKTELDGKVQMVRNQFVGPLERVDEYLTLLGRQKMYQSISESKYDREGRWQAFYDLNYAFHRHLSSDKKLAEWGLQETDISKVMHSAYKVIRQRDFGTGNKVHNVMRQLPKILKAKGGKEEFIKIDKKVDLKIPDKLRYDKDGNEYPPRKLDKIWSEKNASIIINQVKKCNRAVEFSSKRTQTLDILEEVMESLEHENVTPENVPFGDDYTACMELCESISDKALVLGKEFDGYRQTYKKAVNTKKQKRN